jgi:DNA-binding IclR family transcriptional regulator
MADLLVLRAARIPLTGNAKVLLVALAGLAEPDGTLPPMGYERIAECVGLSAATVYTMMNRLMDRGYVVRERRGLGEPSRYRVTLADAEHGGTGTAAVSDV